MRTLLKVSFGCIALCWIGLDCATAENRTIVVLDATAQMSAKFGQQRKIDVVKGAITAAVVRMEPQASLGVWAFGTNPANKCEDRGELVRLQPVQTAIGALSKALSPVQPRAARAPVFGTLQAALESAGEPKDGAISAVVIAGTGDDCLGDICGEAKNLHSAYPNAKLTVLGAGMSEQAAANYTCAAQAMGGSFSAVKSGTDLDRMLRQSLGIDPNAKPVTATLQAAASASAAPAAAPALPVETAPAVPQPPQPEPNTVLSAVLASGMPTLDAGVTWEIYKINTTPTGQLRPAETPAWTAGGGQGKFKLPDGHYQVHVGYGFASAEDSLTVSGSKLEKTIVLGAGTIAAEGLQAPGGPPAEGVFFTLYRRKSAAALEELGRSSEAPAIFHMNAGDYALSASAGPAKLDANVKVEAGKVSAVRMALNTGILEAKTVAAAGSATPVPAFHKLYAVLAGGAKTPAPVLRIAGGAFRVQIPAGNYRLETEYGNARAQSAVSVAAGQTSSQSVVMDAGEAAISGPAGKPAQLCTVFEAGDGHTAGPAGRAAGTSMSFILKAGLYDVECRQPGSPAPAKQTQVQVVAGETRQAKIAE
jgi:hypothetical protein